MSNGFYIDDNSRQKFEVESLDQIVRLDYYFHCSRLGYEENSEAQITNIHFKSKREEMKPLLIKLDDWLKFREDYLSQSIASIKTLELIKEVDEKLRFQ